MIAFPGAALGCHAEYRCVSADGPIAAMPSNLSFTQAAALCFGGCTMLDYYRRAALGPADRVLVNGAAGCVGSAAVQLAVAAGATVTGVCRSANRERVLALGASEVIAYDEVDFATTGRTYDIIVDAVGNAPIDRVAPVLAPRGRLLALVATLGEMFAIPFQSLAGGRRVIAGPAAERPADVVRIAELAAAGRFKPVVDRCYDFDQIVEAHRHVDRGHKQGSVVVTVGDAAA